MKTEGANRMKDSLMAAKKLLIDVSACIERCRDLYEGS